MPKLAVTGSVAYDFISKYDKPFEDVFLPEMLHQLSVSFVVSDKQRHFGGTAGNISYNLALLGEAPFLIAAVGYDFDDYEKRLQKLGINVQYVKRYKDITTPVASIINDPRGCQIAEFYPGAMAAEGDINVNDPFTDAKLIHIAPDDPRRMQHYVEEARSLKTPYFFDPGQNLPYFEGDVLLQAIRGAEGLFLNEYELALLKDKTRQTEDEILDHAKLLVVTHGDSGSRVLSKSEDKVQTYEIPVVTPSEFKDPTGCGDAYRAGFLKGYLARRELKTCGQMGSLLATYDIEQVGTQNHFVTWEEYAARYQSVFSESL